MKLLRKFLNDYLENCPKVELLFLMKATKKKNSGETKALKRFYKKNKKKYKRVILKTGYQPDIYLEKIK